MHSSPSGRIAVPLPPTMRRVRPVSSRFYALVLTAEDRALLIALHGKRK